MSTKCWYVGKREIEEFKGYPCGQYWICEDEDGVFYCKLGKDLFLSSEEAEVKLLENLRKERDALLFTIAALERKRA